MKTDFFRFPHTPHIAWLGEGTPRDDKVLSPAEVQSLLAEEVVVEEKLDGANLGFSVAPDGSLRAQNRGQYLTEPHVGQFSRLSSWIAQHSDALLGALSPDLILFGEWCAARHSLDYDTLPDLVSGVRRVRPAGVCVLEHRPTQLAGSGCRPEYGSTVAAGQDNATGT